MHIIHDLSDFTAPWESSVLTLGVFDGMHRGHQVLAKRLQKRSRKGNRARVLVTYDPHPDLVLGKKKDPRGTELFTYYEKLSLFQKFDIDATVFLHFTRELAGMSAESYLKDILIRRLRAKHIIIGYDQSFGKGRSGNYDFLKKMSDKYDYDVEQISAVKYRGEIISSTLIRNVLNEGDVQRANRLLGHTYFMRGVVVRGHQRGAELGFPTANLEVAETKLIPARGVYACIAEYGPRRYRAMTNIGVKPTFGREEMTVESHILDFNDNLYGEQIRLYFKERLRDETKFSSVDELKKQLVQDRIRTEKMRLVI